MAQTIINSGVYTITKDGQTIVNQAGVISEGVTVFEDEDFTITKTPEFTTWTNTEEPLTYTIEFSNLSGASVDTISITDTMPAATETTAGISLDVNSISAEIIPADNVEINIDESSETQLVVTFTSQESGNIVDGAVLTVTFGTNYLPPIEI